MKTILTVAALATFIAVPSAFAAEFVGVQLPTAIDPLHLFAAFAGVLVALITAGDYARQPQSKGASGVKKFASATKAAHALAA